LPNSPAATVRKSGDTSLISCNRDNHRKTHIRSAWTAEWVAFGAQAPYHHQTDVLANRGLGFLAFPFTKGSAMNARLPLLAFALGLLLSPSTQAAPVPSDPKNQSGPTVALQVKSIDEFTDRLKTTMKSFLPEAPYKEFEKEMQDKIDALKGIDTKRPFAVYAVLGDGLFQGDFAKSSLVALVPVTGEKEFLELIAKKELPVEKEGDVYVVTLPNFPLKPALRFIKGYAFISISGEKLDPRLLLEPQDVIDAKETAAAVLRVRVDRIPQNLKQNAVEFVAEEFEAIKKLEVGAPERDLGVLVLDIGLRWLKLGIDDGKELIVRADLDAKTGAFLIEKSIEAKPGSALAKTYAKWKPTTNEFAGLVGPDAAAHVFAQAPLYSDELREAAGKFGEVLGKMAQWTIGNGAPPEVRTAVTECFAALGRTVKDDRLDLAAALRGPDKNDQYTAIGAVSAKDTAAFEKALKDLLKVAPKEVTDKVKIDAFKVGDVSVHEIVVGDELPPEAQKIFTKSSVFIAFAPNAVYASFGAQAREALKEAVLAKRSPKPAPIVAIEFSGKRLLPLIKKTKAPLDGPEGDFLKRLTAKDRINVYSIKCEGGERFVVRMEYGYLPIMGYFLVGRSSEKAFQQVAPQAVPAAPIIEKKPVEEKKVEEKKPEKK
jgi:hypothetical protein